ncbi:hypothetical protein OIDMADRAFT_31037 [Oidiodendron maius Zn]|uniref:DUF6570 domain-containing protein n=1 Tax=Oidiodendron maius (strain Zn) TaxID=913774 RepID=A0A0C3D8G7_OIDMZ|nr:hypothetical protein OIDMADRAFT_31037 [Oidiodendron maius Zn]
MNLPRPCSQEVIEDGRVQQSSSIVAGIRAEERPSRERRVQSPRIRIQVPPSRELLPSDRVLQLSSITTNLHAFLSELVEQTRTSIRAESQLLQDIVIKDTPRVLMPRVHPPTTQTPRIQIPRIQTLRNGQSSPIAASLQAFPSELVEETREKIRAESRLIQNIVFEERSPRVQRPRVQELSQVKENSCTRLRLLEEEHSRIAVASEAFPPIIISSILRKCTKEYYQILETGSRRESCASCGVLLETGSLFQVTKEEPYISANLSYLDSCRIRESLVTLCNECKISLRENKAPKFSGNNFINTTLCQAYPVELEGLTYIEECVIVLAYSIAAIVKLTSGGRLSGIEYSGSRGHFITFKQDLSWLLTILLSSALELHNSSISYIR